MDLDTTVNELAPRLLAYCRSTLRDVVVAEEATQIALTALVERWRSAGPPENPASFVFTVARRRGRRLLWRRRLFAPLTHGVDFATTAPGPERQALHRSDLVATRAAVARLPGPDREALRLVAQGDLSMAEAAERARIKPAAFKMRVFRARRRLAGLLAALSLVLLGLGWWLTRGPAPSPPASGPISVRLIAAGRLVRLETAEGNRLLTNRWAPSAATPSTLPPDPPVRVLIVSGESP